MQFGGHGQHLWIEANRDEALKYRDFASDLLAKWYEVPGWEACIMIAPLGAILPFSGPVAYKGVLLEYDSFSWKVS